MFNSMVLIGIDTLNLCVINILHNNYAYTHF